MTSLFTSMFGQATQIASRIEQMKQAEAALISFASRFSHSENTHTIELFDTEIPLSSVPLQSGVYCQIYPETNGDNKGEGGNLVMHGIKVQSNEYDGSSSSTKAPPLVLLHGYANGALYFYRNLLGLSNHSFEGTVYALDLLGWGLSSRPQFKTKTLEGHDRISVTEDFFVESLEQWRKAHKLEKITLAGHSLGGHISVCYAEKYPQYVHRLILLSPVGVPDDGGGMKARVAQQSYTVRFMVGAVSMLWNYGVTPSSFVRAMPETRGRNMVSSYIERRLPTITCPDERKHLTEYLYMNAKLPGSGENCLNKILEPFALAKRPSLNRIARLNVRNIYFIYGQHDWMDAGGGIEVQRICDQMKRDGTSENVPNVSVLGVKNAGHLLMLENWEEFNSAVLHAAGENLPQDAPKPFIHDESKASDGFFKRMTFQKRAEKYK
mmetsp:Transcript_6054/g.9102  ORF Transcript_6054/g.9102 Transcript_6054/m.9102 type:complete len:437 (-) Transcript_6054:116-1426(-)|eukprot:CAMPEP_0203682660 /NCGR_PEP_ID=MMETSP0090-20130426/46695_1 /ASSEMBLY_ACC=CAM_ASM_001088 /TAXON_ID=426623 /ORGANISM="Chaetoceros affinis, Strain CCMP159" /LENGTH=436 /DNA_ID=CAMNT_0050551715 /DNA_START=21 /DNA_END=1331 /DNA_ORIENTATION=+